ncbi:MAG: hypothetical protein H6712_30925 [Myxococcales bacterium]|nr:hypothetical protein [Myxococcales bacterium]MCB9718305.1 hypothetical protein [Myxococcales bacterium]
MPSISGIPAEAQHLFDVFHDGELASLPTLRDELAAYAERIAARTPANEMLDASVSQALTRSCEALLELAEGADEPTRRLVQAAVRYFVDEDDVEPDRDTMWGLDDDAAVCNAVARHLGREDLVVEVS